jgi:hypothetical protein
MRPNPFVAVRENNLILIYDTRLETLEAIYNDNTDTLYVLMYNSRTLVFWGYMKTLLRSFRVMGYRVIGVGNFNLPFLPSYQEITNRTMSDFTEDQNKSVIQVQDIAPNVRAVTMPLGLKVFFSFNLTIAFRWQNQYYVNNHKYTATTSKHREMLIREQFNTSHNVNRLDRDQFFHALHMLQFRIWMGGPFDVMLGDQSKLSNKETE